MGRDAGLPALLHVSAVSLRHAAARGVRWTFLGTVATAVTQLVQLVVLSRLLAPRDFGIMGVLLVVTGFALAYTDLGISAAIVQRRDATREQLSSLYWLNVAMGAAVFAVAWAAAPLAVAFFREAALLAPLRVLSVMFLLVPLGKQFEMLLQRDLEFDVLARTEIAGAVIGTAVAVGAAFAGAGVWALVAGALAGAGVRAAMLGAIGLRRFRPSLHFRRADLEGFLSFGAYQVGEQSINYLGERLDQLLLGRLLGVGPLGFYNFAFNLTSQPLSRINPVVNRVAYPTFCQLQGDRERLRRGFLRVVQLLVTVNAPLLAGLAAVAPLLIPAVFGEKWVPSVPLVQLLAVLALSRSLGNPMGSVLLARGRADIGFRLNVLLIVLSVPALWIGGRQGGAVGIVGGLLAVQAVLHVVVFRWILRPQLGMHVGEYVAVLARPIALALLMAAAVWALPIALPTVARVPMLGLQIVAGAVLYLGALAATDRDALRELASLASSRA